jgi:hypothetical protein
MNAAGPPPPNQSPVAGAVNAITNAAAGAATAVSGAINAAANAAGNMFTNAPRPNNGLLPNNAARANNGARANNAAKANNGMKSNNGGMTFNSLIPLGNASSPPPANMNRAPNIGVNNAPPTFTNVSAGHITKSPWFVPLSIFAGLVVLFLVAFSVFNAQIKHGYEYVTSSFQQAMGLNSQPAVMADIIPIQGDVKDITVAPVAPQDITPRQDAQLRNSIVEKILPQSGDDEVFNISKNKFTYHDAQPLCKALGAELATYEQVKDAWAKGADWCNYGWVKGQMAIYPTQKDTYDKLQTGPDDQRTACGTTGINGGYFDNPDMLYGVNCYGNKPSQSAHDEDRLMDEGKIPKSPETLKVDQMVNEFKKEADSLFVRPFNDKKWHSV